MHALFPVLKTKKNMCNLNSYLEAKLADGFLEQDKYDPMEWQAVIDLFESIATSPVRDESTKKMYNTMMELALKHLTSSECDAWKYTKAIYIARVCMISHTLDSSFSNKMMETIFEAIDSPPSKI